MAKTYKKKARRTTRKSVKLSVPRFRKVMINMQEKKFYDFNVISIPCGAGMAQSLLYGTSALWGGTASPTPHNIAQGTSANTRIGNKIFIHSIEVTMNLTPQVNAGMTQGCLMRVGMYHNKECNGVQITFGQIFQDATLPFSCRNQAYRPKVTVLKDIQQNAVVTGVDSTGVVKAVGPNTISRFKIFPKKLINYSAATATIADILKDDYGVFMICNNTSVMAMSLTCQIVFSDA